MQKGGGGGAMGMPNPPIHPIDKGWAWMIVVGLYINKFQAEAGIKQENTFSEFIAGFGANFFVNGLLRSTGIFVAYIVAIYQTDPSYAALTVAFMCAGFALLSPVGNMIGLLFTNRVACIIGGVLVFIGVFLSAFAKSATTIIMGLGLLSGIGFAFEYGPSMVMVSQHFKARLSLANGLAAAGGSVGTLLIPILIQMTAAEYGFSGTLLIFSAIVLHAIPFALLLRPITAYPKAKPATVEMALIPPPEQLKAAEAKEEINYELVGSQILAVETPCFGSVPDLSKAEGAPQPPPAGPPGAGGAPPKMTLGIFLRIFCQRLCDKELLKDVAFLCYLFGIAFGQAGYISNLTFLPTFSKQLFPTQNIAIVISVIGIADLFGRIGGGWFADLGYIKKPYILGFSFLGSGVATILLPFFHSYAVLIGYAIILGVLGGTYQAQMVVIIVETFGPAKTPSGLGLTQMVMGIAILPMPPILGGLGKAMGFGIVMRICGVLLVIAAALFYALPTANQRTRNKQAKKAAAAAAETPAVPA